MGSFWCSRASRSAKPPTQGLAGGSCEAYPPKRHYFPLFSFKEGAVSPSRTLRLQEQISVSRFRCDVIRALTPGRVAIVRTCPRPGAPCASFGVSCGLSLLLGEKKANSQGRMMSDFHTEDNISRISKLI